jgi:hypothetical protein
MPESASEDRDRFRVSPTPVPPVRRARPRPDPTEIAVVSSGARQVALPGTTEELSRVQRATHRSALPAARAGDRFPPVGRA